MTAGDAHLWWPSERGPLRGLVERVVGRFVTLLGRVPPLALALRRHLPAREPHVDRKVRDRPRPLIGQLAPARSTPPAPRGRVRLRGERSAPFSTVRVVPEFGPRNYQAIFAALQEPTGSKLLDLVPARLLCTDLFEGLAGAWTVGRETVPRLALLVSFERWVMLRDAVLASLQPLTARGMA